MLRIMNINASKNQIDRSTWLHISKRNKKKSLIIKCKIIIIEEEKKCIYVCQLSWTG